MFDSNILEVGIGLVFVYLLCSLICSAIKEWISRLFNMRSNDLEARISYLLDNETLATNLIGHPLIQTTTRRTLLDKLLKRPGKPSNINPRIFATVLTDLLIKASGTTEIKMGKDNSIYKRKMLLDLERGIDKYEIKAGPVLKAMLQTAKMETDRIEEIMANVREQFSQWFDGAMTELSKWYKQKTRLILFVIAVIICSLFNIDTIMIAKKLYQDNDLRKGVMVAAAEIAGDSYTDPADILKREELKPIVKVIIEKLNALHGEGNLNEDAITSIFVEAFKIHLSNIPQGDLKGYLKQRIEHLLGLYEHEPVDRNHIEEVVTGIVSEQVAAGLKQIARQRLDELKELNLIGWASGRTAGDDPMGFPDEFMEWIFKIIGIFITALAVAMGAPFWFGLLQSMIRIRNLKNPKTERV